MRSNSKEETSQGNKNSPHRYATRSAVRKSNSSTVSGENDHIDDTLSQKSSSLRTIFRRVSRERDLEFEEDDGHLPHVELVGNGDCPPFNNRQSATSREQPVIEDSSSEPILDSMARTRRKYLGMVPMSIALGAVVIMIVPLLNILGYMDGTLKKINNEMISLRNKFSSDDDFVSSAITKSSNEAHEFIRRCVREEMEMFQWDRIGKRDFASLSSGGRIVKIIDTENYGKSSSFLGFELCQSSSGPSAMIQANSGVGECWAFKGSKGGALIKLIGKVSIEGVSLEHIPRSLSPTGTLDTAPKEFIIYGLDGPEGTKKLLGKFEYKTDSTSVQYFPIEAPNVGTFDHVEFHVQSNHGSKEFTCVYRLRVHGVLQNF